MGQSELPVVGVGKPCADAAERNGGGDDQPGSASWVRELLFVIEAVAEGREQMSGEESDGRA